MLRTIFAPWLAVYDLACELKAEQRHVKRLEATVLDQAQEIRDVRARCAADEAQIDEWGDKLLAQAAELNRLRAQLAKFDHDGDGKVGGSGKRLKSSADGNAANPTFVRGDTAA